MILIDLNQVLLSGLMAQIAGQKNVKLEEGLVLAVEPMINMGKAETEVLRDHWTVVTRDGLPSVHVEHTLALTKDGVFVLTSDEDLIIKI